MRTLLYLFISAAGLFSASAMSTEEVPGPRGLNFDRFSYVSQLNNRFFELYDDVFDGLLKDEVSEAKLLELNHMYSLRAHKLQPQVDLAWYQAMHSIHRILAQKTGRMSSVKVERVSRVDLDPSLWPCSSLLQARQT